MVRDSAFNLAIGPLVKLWRIGFQGHSVPPRMILPLAWR
jgi:thiamine biosynthesis lipoprotein